MFRSQTYYFCVILVKLLIAQNGVDEQDYRLTATPVASRWLRSLQLQ